MQLAPTASMEAGNSPFFDIDFSCGVIAAVSGGSDSIALLLLLKEHLERIQSGAKLLAVTVDHALRASSAAEATAVGQLCGSLGIAHRTLVWTGAKPGSGIPAAAREARYRLLAQAARSEGIGIVLTGHTADDQAETVAMRQRRSAVNDRRGLAGMAPATLYDGSIWILRPLLGARRESLRAMLRHRQVRWIDDPTNVDTAYERPRVRALVGSDQEEFSCATASAVSAARERTELGVQAAGLIETLASQPVRGLIRLEPEFSRVEDRMAAIYALRMLLAVVGGISFLPDKSRSAALFDRLAAGPLRSTLSRVTIDARRACIFLHREARGLPPLVPASDIVSWDGRRSITFGNMEEGLVIAPAGADHAAKLVKDWRGAAPRSLARAALCAEPALWREGKCLGLAENGAVSGLEMQPVAAPWARFLPAFDLVPARCVSGLIGAAKVPCSPFHKTRDAKPRSKT